MAAAMTAAPTTVHEREDAAEAIAKMAAGGFRHVPVLRSGGGLALLDVARCLYDAMTLLEDASAGGALLDAVARRCGRAPAVLRARASSTPRGRWRRRRRRSSSAATARPPRS